ncbi:MAG TPA: hypothetical protein VFS21_29785, partial [Roseiflexaceae bacterium]|nr:hypothetical protein [Roseiflexaceae bacterium]
GVAVSLGLDALRRRSPLPGPDQPLPTSAIERIYLRALWTPASAFVLAVLLSAAAAATLAALNGQDAGAAVDLAIRNAFASQATWAARWLVLNPRKRSLPVLED